MTNIDAIDSQNPLPTESIEHANDSPRGDFPKRHLRLAAFTAVSVCLVACHSSLLRVAYGILVVDQSTENCQYAIIATPTPECFDAAARMVADDSIEAIFIVEPRPNRTVRIGAIPSIGELWKQDLLARDVPRERIRTLQTDAVTPHQLFRELERVLSAKAESSCAVISTSTLSHYYRQVIDGALPPSGAVQYRVHSVLPMASDRSSWWRSRSGVARVTTHGLRLAFVMCSGESIVDSKDPYAYLTVTQAAP